MYQIRTLIFKPILAPALSVFLFLIVLDFGPQAVSAADETVVTTASEIASPSPKEITIGFIPSDDPVKLKAGALELAKHLQETLHVHINVLVTKNYQTLIDAMKNKKIDFAFFTALSFVFAEKDAGAKVLLKKIWQNPFYYSVVLTEKSRKINKIEELKGKSMAFIDQRSTSGYLYPLVMLEKKSIDPAKFFSKVTYAGNHEAAVKELAEGKVDAIATFADDEKGLQSAWMKFYPKRGKDIKVLWVSEPIPNDPFTVRRDFYDQYPRFTHDLMFSLIDLKSDMGKDDDLKKDGSIAKNFFERNLGFTSLDLATTRQYQPVREMVKLLNFKLE